MSAESRACFICGSQGKLAYEAKIDPAKIGEFTYASRKLPELMHYEYNECESCRMLFATNLPAREELLADYEGAAFDAAVESQFAARAYLRGLRPILAQVSSVLDIGCGDGEFLLACREYGIDKLKGIEPSTAASSIAREGIGDVIVSGGFEDQPADEKFDLITLFQTIEHIDDPLGFFEKSKELAVPGGYVAVACHDYTAPVNRLMKEKSPIFDIEHLQIFSPRSIGKAMTKVGLEVVSIKSYANTYPLSYWMRLAPVPTALKTSDLITKRAIGRLPLRLPIGNLMAIAKVPGPELPVRPR